MKRRAALLPLLFLAGCGDQADDEKPAEPVAQVRVGSVVIGTSSDTVVAYGVTEAAPGADRSLIAPAEAIVATIAAPTGTAVRVGQAIVTLRPSPTTRTELAKAASDAQMAEAAFQRALRLRGDGLASNAEVEAARAAAQTARATRANLGLGAAGLTLRAPVAGTVQNLTAKPGDQIAAGTTLATVAMRGDLRARLSVDPAVAQRVHAGQTIILQAAEGGAEMRVPVVGVDPQLDPSTRLAAVFVRVPGGDLSAGSPVRATLSVGKIESGLSIPYAALLDDGGRSYVYVVRAGVARSVDVSPGNTSGDRVEILKGLQPNDRVVTQGGTALEDGMKVRVAGVDP